MPKIFISYRRSASSGHAGRLYDRLVKEYGDHNVFLDVEQIPIGETFSSYLLAKIDESDVFLLMLGEGTLDRVVNEDDWVRREIAYALSHDHVVVVPVLQDGFKIPPPETLPADIQGITARNAAFLFHQMFDESVHKVIGSINALFPPEKSTPKIDEKRETNSIPVRVIETPKPSPAGAPSAEGTGTVKIHRVGNLIMYRARSFGVTVDGREVRSIGNDETITLELPAGQHVIGVDVDLHHPKETITLRDGEVQSLEIHVRNMGLNIDIVRV